MIFGYSGRFFTWSNKQAGSRRVFSNIDRVLGNDEWEDLFPRAHVSFLPGDGYNHSPMLIQFFLILRGHKAFSIGLSEQTVLRLFVRFEIKRWWVTLAISSIRN